MYTKEIPEILIKYPTLKYVTYPAQKRYQLNGKISFEAEYGGTYFVDEYQVQISWDDNRPIPRVSETGGRIASDYPHRYDDGSLCLAAPAELFRHFAEGKGLVSFIDVFLISYLFTYSYWEKYGTYPYGERSHGNAGEIEYFLELLNINNATQIEPFLEKIASEYFRYRGHKYCPCGSGHLMRSCQHKKFLLNLPPTSHLQYCLDRYRERKKMETITHGNE